MTAAAQIIPFPTPTPVISDRKPHEPVEPIKSLEDIEAAKQYFLDQPVRYRANVNNLRNYMMLVVNINNAVRIGDLLKLKIGDVLTKSGNIREEIFIRESKTKKTRYMYFGPASKQAILQYLNALPSFEMSDYLFASRKKAADGSSKAIDRRSAWEIISKMGKAISEHREKKLHLGTHSFRKTFGYQKVKANPNDQMILAQVSSMYNHASLNTTYRYLGIDSDTMKELCFTHEL